MTRTKGRVPLDIWLLKAALLGYLPHNAVVYGSFAWQILLPPGYSLDKWKLWQTGSIPNSTKTVSSFNRGDVLLSTKRHTEGHCHWHTTWTMNGTEEPRRLLSWHFIPHQHCKKHKSQPFPDAKAEGARVTSLTSVQNLFFASKANKQRDMSALYF